MRNALPAAPNVVERLAERIRYARSLGFDIRKEMLGGQAGACCEIAGRKTLFIDAAQTAAEQILAIDESIRRFERLSHRQ